MRPCNDIVNLFITVACPWWTKFAIDWSTWMFLRSCTHYSPVPEGTHLIQQLHCNCHHRRHHCWPVGNVATQPRGICPPIRPHPEEVKSLTVLLMEDKRTRSISQTTGSCCWSSEACYSNLMSECQIIRITLRKYTNIEVSFFVTVSYANQLLCLQLTSSFIRKITKLHFWATYGASRAR